MAYNSLSAKGYDPSNLEVTLANQLSGPAGNQLLGFLYAARLDREQGNQQYQQDAMQLQQLQNVSAREKAQYDFAAAMAGKDASLMLTNPGRSIVAPGAEGLLSNLSLGLPDAMRADTLKNSGAGMRDLSSAGIAPPMGAEITPTGLPTTSMTQSAPLAIRLKQTPGAGEGSGTASPDLAQQKLTLQQVSLLTKRMNDFDKLEADAAKRLQIDLATVAKNFPFDQAKQRAAADAVNKAYAETKARLAEGRNATMQQLQKLGSVAETVVAPTTTTTVATPDTSTSTNTQLDVNREIALARDAIVKKLATRDSVAKKLQAKGIDPALLDK